MKTVVRLLPPGRLDSARSYIFRDDEFGSGYMRSSRDGGASCYSRWIFACKPKLCRGYCAENTARSELLTITCATPRQNNRGWRNRTRPHAASPMQAVCIMEPK